MEKYGRAGEATDEVIWRIHFACWKTDHTHTKYIIPFLLYGDNGYTNARRYVYMYIACLVLISD